MKNQANYPVVEAKATDKNHFCMVMGQKVYLTEEMQKDWDQYINHVHNAAIYRKTCSQPDYHKCYGECCGCKYAVEGLFVSLDRNKVDRDSLYVLRDGDSASPLDDMLIAQERMNTIYKIAKKAIKRGDEILRLYFEEHMTFEEMADYLGEHDTTLRRRYHKLMELLREQKEIWD